MSVQNELIGLSCWLAVSVCQEPSIRQPVVADVFHHLNLKKTLQAKKPIICFLKDELNAHFACKNSNM